MTSTARPTILDRLDGVRQTGSGWSAKCPGHKDGRASLSVALGDDGRTLLHCHAGCTFAAIVAAAGLSEREQFSEGDGNGHHRNGTPRRTPAKPSTTFPTADAAIASYERQLGKHSARWAYLDADGNVIGYAVRWDRADGGKEFRPVTFDGSGWVKTALPQGRTLYALPDLAGADVVYVTEGEKTADAVRSIGLVSTTSPGGSQAAGQADWSPLAGKRVIILPDHDLTGK